MAKKQSNTIPAVAYMRKSTAGETNGKERQEKSISQQRQEIESLAKDRYHIVRWYTDEGVSGWKRDGKRPGFDRMLADAKERGDFQAILCDDLDRFSRAEVMEVFSDLSTLSSAGVRAIHCVNQGEYGLGQNDIGEILKMVVDVHGGNEYSRKLSRRIALARRNKAREGKRSGGGAPYGMKNDAHGGLVHGDEKKLDTVRWIFDQFANQNESLRWIARRLHEAGTPAPGGGDTWYPATVRQILTRAAYAGVFEFGSQASGQFYHTAADGEVVESNGHGPNEAPAFVQSGVYEPVVDRKTYQRAQRRIESFRSGRRPHHDGYALSRILVCDHCGSPMYGTRLKKLKGQPVVYRCTSSTVHGRCSNFQIREDRILRFILHLLDEEIDEVTKAELRPTLPDSIAKPSAARQEQQAELEQQIARLTAKIEKAEERILEVDDKRTRQSLDRRISEWRNEVDRLQAEQETAKPEPMFTDDQRKRLRKWYEDAKARSFIIPGKRPSELTTEEMKQYRSIRGQLSRRMDRRALNELLHGLGTEIRLRFKAEVVNVRKRYRLDRGRFRLGQQSERLNCSVAGSFRKMSR